MRIDEREVPGVKPQVTRGTALCLALLIIMYILSLLITIFTNFDKDQELVSLPDSPFFEKNDGSTKKCTAWLFVLGATVNVIVDSTTVRHTVAVDSTRAALVDIKERCGLISKLNV